MSLRPGEIVVERASRSFSVRADPGRSLKEALFRRARGGPPTVPALRDVSFRIAPGETVGIVGRNGAGKTSTLRVLAGIVPVDAGRVEVGGRVVAQLELGAGFGRGFTGRENVFLNAALYGLTREEVEQRLDAILAFAELGEFADLPVATYSQGMFLRLGFAIAAHLDPDVLLVDEVLAVGDAEFQRKCLNRMSTAGAEGRTVIFVSHDLAALSKLCSRAIWLEAGQIRDQGPTAPIVRDYLTSGFTSGSASAPSGGSAAGRLLEVRVEAADGSGRPLVRDEPFRVVTRFQVDEERLGLDLAVFLTNQNGVRVFDETLSHSQEHRFPVGRYEVALEVPPVLAHGDYTVGLWLGTALDDVHYEPSALAFTLHGEEAVQRDRVVVLGLPFHVRPLG